MKLLVDMNLSPRWVPALQACGVEAVHWSSVGSKDAPDTALLEYAAQNGYVIFTRDLDFGALLYASRQHSPSVIQLRDEQALPETMAPVLAVALRQMRAELEQGAFLTLDARRCRVRLLPM
ncbi:MAG: DUF5615 family PIN-like protein [Ottowia sp.]|nr:DUF5615 family PIN-like protein [Ottowia sp.]